jgi:two-component system, cell cycle sensor histidine kinase and response regulator CckA
LIDYVFNPEPPGEPYTFIRKEGDALWAEAETQIQGKRYVLSSKAKPLYDSNGAITGAIESLWDVTDRKLMEEEIKWMNTELQQTVAERTAELLKANRALEEDIVQRIRGEEAIRESERRYREMAELLPETVFECDEVGKLTFVNSQYYVTFGYSPEEFDKGLTIFQMLIPDDQEKAKDAMQQILAGARRSGIEYTGLRKDGETFPILVNSSSIIHQGRHVGIRGFAVDISDHKRIAAELLKVQKLESVGILAGGIAHDFNNLLAAIIGYIDLARLSFPQEQRNDRNLERARVACLQASELTKRLITFSKGGEPLCREISLVQLIKETCDQSLKGSPVQYSITPVEGLWPVLADVGQLKQVIHHLVLNAREAMPDGGTIVVTAGNTLVDESTDLPLKHGAYVKWSVRDSGKGISPENLTRIFDPYFTTKDLGSEKGMGLGLAICYSVVKRHNGLILAASEPGMGSTFRVYLPAAVPADVVRENVDSVPRERPLEAAVSGGRILLMDDEAYIRELMRDMLDTFGYRVEVAKEGNEAIDLYKKAQASNQPFAGVILDLEIPGGLGGEFVIRRLLELNPGIKAIVASGYSDDPILKEYRSYGFKGAIAKPFTLESLGSVLKEVIRREE